MKTFSRAAVAAALFAVPTVAFAHGVLEPSVAAPGVPWQGAAVIGHGCDGLATTGVRLKLPDGAQNVTPGAAPAGWTVSRDGSDLVWSGGSLGPKERGAFPFAATFSGSVGDQRWVEIDQSCGDKLVRWAQIPAAGQDAHELKEPAASLKLVAEADMPKVYTLGALRIDQPWSRATPKGAPVAGGYLRVTNTGTAPDKLVGASFALAAKGEVHEMKMEGGVMKMAELPDGLEVPAGGSVELAPGGFHLMFVGLKDQVTEGQRIAGALTFAKAGTVQVEFQVRAMNAGGGHQH